MDLSQCRRSPYPSLRRDPNAASPGRKEKRTNPLAALLRSRPILEELERREMPAMFNVGAGDAATLIGHFRSGLGDELVFGAGAGGGPQVTAFDVRGPQADLEASFDAVNPNAEDVLTPNGGAAAGVRVGRVLVGGQTDLLTALGPGGPPLVTIFDSTALFSRSPEGIAAFFAFDSATRLGVFPAG